MKRAAIVLLALGLLGALATLLLYPREPDRMAVAICASWWFGLTIAIGALGTIMVLNLSHATWFVVFRPMTSSVAATLPLLALGLLPAALVARHVYPWAGAVEGIPHDVLHRIERTRPWMSPWPVYARTLLSLGLWSTLAVWLRATSTTGRARVASGVGVPVLAITATVTPFDWMMRAEPGWRSSIFGMYVAVSGFYGATGLVAILAWLAVRRQLLKPDEVRPDHFHAHGRLMLTAVCLWGYLAFFQLMLQWVGNIPAEVQFYARRALGPWAGISAALVLGHFVVPFFALLSRPLKRRPDALAAVGAVMLLTHVLDVAWLIVPSRAPGLFATAAFPFAAVVGLAGAWGLWRFSSLSPVADRDPDFPRGARYESP